MLPRIGTSITVYRENLGNLFLLGGLIVGSTTIILVALNDTTAINVSLINATQPTITVLFSWLFFFYLLNLLWLLLMSTYAFAIFLVQAVSARPEGSSRRERTPSFR